MKKKLILVASFASLLLFVGCGTKPNVTTEGSGMVLTGDQMLTGTNSGDVTTGLFDDSNREEMSGEETTATNQTGPATQTGTQTSNGSQTSTGPATGTTTLKDLPAVVSGLVQERSTKPSDPNKLTEDDIDLIEQIIQKIENIGK